MSWTGCSYYWFRAVHPLRNLSYVLVTPPYRNLSYVVVTLPDANSTFDTVAGFQAFKLSRCVWGQDVSTTLD